MDARFAATTTVPPWPDPHAVAGDPFGRSPGEEEYSRVTHPGRYAVLHERIDAWLAELVDRGLADVRPVAPEGAWLLEHHHHPGEHLRQAVPRRPGALELTVETWAPGPDLPAGVVIGVGTPAVLLERLPFCGCDACDDGSALLLDQLDEVVLRVLDGSLRVEVGAERIRIAWSNGSSAGGVVDEEERRAVFGVLGGRIHRLSGVPWDRAWPAREPHG
ncbi:MAG: DUF6226 family protein [Marmoricola sp.]